MSGHHFGRAWHGTRIEDACPCPQEPCGLVALDRAHPDCIHHPFARAKSMRQSHRAQDCPGPPAPPAPPAPVDPFLRRAALRLIRRRPERTS